MKLYTIGFTKKNAKQFFEALKHAGIKKLLDIRLNNTSQLAGFTKKEDLEYFARIICNISYHHLPQLAPTHDILDAYKKKDGSWSSYEASFRRLMEERRAIEELETSFFEELCCLLCSEPTPERCHRRLVAEAIRKRWPELQIIHL